MQNFFSYGLIVSGLIAAVAGSSASKAPWFYAGTVMIFLGALILIAKRSKKKRASKGSLLARRPNSGRRPSSNGGEHETNGHDGDGGDGD